ncbi:MAG: hypothetical protein KA354_17340 [Phycisphaerae bacterium]|nr:hypothetical protein [Phycisphaerae bacterium]
MADQAVVTEQMLEKRIVAQRSATLVQALALIGAGAFIALGAWLQAPINRARVDLQLVTQSNVYKELPPVYGAASAAGGVVRGIAILNLWITSEKLKEEGKYYAAHQYANWICTLQPRFPAVWSFQSWNMAYNISVATHTPRERWQWVYNGIRLLRDEGIPNNPKTASLYHQLGWTWFHKVGQNTDDKHWYYKRNWAAMMEILLGPPPAGLSSAATIDWFRPVAEAPTTTTDLLAKHPQLASVIAVLSEAGVDLAAETDSQRLFHPLEETFFRPYTAWRLDQQLHGLRSPEAVREARAKLDSKQEKLWGVFDSNPDGFDTMLAHLRARVLREQYKMDPKYMLALTGQLNTDQPIPIDWRTPWAQSLYWTKWGTEQAAQYKATKEFDILNTDRIQLFSLATLARQGRYTFRLRLDEWDKSFLWTSPDIRFVEAMHRKYQELGKKHAEEGEEIGETAGETLRSGHVNNLHAAVVNLWLAGKKDEAGRYLDYLAKNYKDPGTTNTKAMYLKGLDDFAFGELREMVGSFTDAIYAISGLLTSAYVSLGNGNGEEYAANVQNAALLFKTYQEEYKDSDEGRMILLKFPDLRATALANFVTDVGYPLLYRSLAWSGEQNEIKQRCYDLIYSDLANQCRILNLDVNRAFPEPEGMAQWRKENPTPENPEDVQKGIMKQENEAKSP